MTTEQSNAEIILSHRLAPIAPLLERADINDIIVNGHNRVWTKTGAGIQRHPDHGWDNEDALLYTIEDIASNLGQPVNDENPKLDALLPDGSRVGAMLYPYCSTGNLLVIRKFPKEHYTIDDLLEFGMLTKEQWRDIRGVLVNGGNIITSGRMGCGKTTLQRCMISEYPATANVILIEDTAETKSTCENVVSLEAAARKDSGRDPVMTMDDLMFAQLRYAGDRLVVGEMRTPAVAWTFLNAMLLGTDCLTTMHAKSAKMAMERFALMCWHGSGGGGDAREYTRDLVKESLTLVVHVGVVDGKRKVQELLFVDESGR